MATYLQGVTDYIPDYQPFQPDLNFYANLMQTKQTQYDTNWNQLNNLYGQLYGADLTHDQNIKKKDELLRQIDFNLKRVSGLDLSLEQNVNQALQVFRPFYEDKYLIKDMAWTKNFKNTYTTAQALANSADPKQSSKYWDLGMKGLEYRRQMFKDATLDETLSFGDAQYVNKVDDIKEYMDFAKKYDIGMVTQTPSGMYMIRKKNGEQLLPGLQQIFWAQYGNRPDIQNMYKEEAFVERMDYATQNANKFGGNKLEAEKEYIRAKYDWLKNITKKADVEAKDDLNTVQNLNSNLQSNIARGNVNPLQKSYQQELEEAMGVVSEVERYTSEVNEQVNGTTSSPVNKDELFNNIELARLKVDAGFASYKAGVKINEAAGSYAYSNYEVEYKPDAVAIAQFREQQANQRLYTGHQMRLKENEQVEKLKRISDYQKAMVAGGRAFYKADGSIELNPQESLYEIIFKGKSKQSGQSGGDKTQFDVMNSQVRDEVINKKAGPGVQSMMTYINELVRSGQFNGGQLGQVLNQFRSNDPEIDKIINDYVKSPSNKNLANATKIWNQIYNEYDKGDKDKFVSNLTKYGNVYHLNTIMKDYAIRHNGNTLMQEYANDQSVFELEVLGRHDEALAITQANNAKKLQNKFKEELTFSANKLREQGHKVSDQQVNNALQKIMGEYVASGYNWEAIRNNAENLDKMINNELGASFVKDTKSGRDRSWWEYTPIVYTAESIYDAATGNRENVAASWITDILNKPYIELVTDKNPDKALRSFVKTIPLGDDMVSLSADTQTVKVDSDYAGDFGFQAAAQAIQDALSLPAGDNYSFALSNNLPAEGEDDGLDDDLAKTILRTLYNRMGDPKLGDFTLSTSRVSRENSKLGSTTFDVPRSVVEEVVKSLKGADFTEQQLKQTIDGIVQNGITAIAPHDYWTHKLWNTSTPTATEVILNTKPIEYTHPLNAGSYTINKVSGVPGIDYEAIIRQNILDVDGSIVELVHKKPGGRTGRGIEDIELEAHSLLAKQDMLNKEMYKHFRNINNPELVDKAHKNLGITPNNPFWK